MLNKKATLIFAPTLLLLGASIANAQSDAEKSRCSIGGTMLEDIGGVPNSTSPIFLPKILAIPNAVCPNSGFENLERDFAGGMADWDDDPSTPDTHREPKFAVKSNRPQKKKRKKGGGAEAESAKPKKIETGSVYLAGRHDFDTIEIDDVQSTIATAVTIAHEYKHLKRACAKRMEELDEANDSGAHSPPLDIYSDELETTQDPETVLPKGSSPGKLFIAQHKHAKMHYEDLEFACKIATRTDPNGPAGSNPAIDIYPPDGTPDFTIPNVVCNADIAPIQKFLDDTALKLFFDEDGFPGFKQEALNMNGCNEPTPPNPDLCEELRGLTAIDKSLPAGCGACN